MLPGLEQLDGRHCAAAGLGVIVELRCLPQREAEGLPGGLSDVAPFVAMTQNPAAILTSCKKLLYTTITLTAGGDARNQHSVIFLKVTHCTTDFCNNTYTFVTQNTPRGHSRDIAFENTEIRSTNSGFHDFYNRVSRLQYCG